jgi:hypothetical protein
MAPALEAEDSSFLAIGLTGRRVHAEDGKMGRLVTPPSLMVQQLSICRARPSSRFSVHGRMPRSTIKSDGCGRFAAFGIRHSSAIESFVIEYRPCDANPKLSRC